MSEQAGETCEYTLEYDREEMERRRKAFEEEPYGLRVLGRIVNVMADEKVLDEQGRIDCGKIGAFVFDQMRFGYYGIGEYLGQAWNIGKEYLKK